MAEPSYPRSADEEKKTQNVWLKGHSGVLNRSLALFGLTLSGDFGTVTMLYSQPVSALQILSSDGKWRWIKHIDNALV